MTYHVIGYRKEIVRKNLRNSFPEKAEGELRAIEKKFYRNLADISVETLKTLTISSEELLRRVTFHGNLIEETHSMGKPFIIMTSHLSNWEWELVAFSKHYPVEIHAVYQQLRNKFFDKLMLQVRGHFGAIMHEKKEVIAVMAQMQSKVYALAMVSDQRPFSGERRYWAPFLNQDAAFYSGSEIMARRMDLPVVYCSMHRRRRGYYDITWDSICTKPGLMEKNEIIKTFIRLMERDIKKDPSSYLWSHDRWKHKKPTESD